MAPLSYHRRRRSLSLRLTQIIDRSNPVGQRHAWMTSQVLSERVRRRIHLLEGHAHFAHKTDPLMVTSVMRDFVSSGRVDGQS